MQILIIDNNIDPDSWGASELRTMAKFAADATVYVRRAPAEDLPASPRGFDRIIVSGSKTSMEEAPWIDQLESFVRRAVESGKPLLGICYGHQILARALGGKDMVRRASRYEYGWGKVEITDPDSRLFQGLPRVFHTFQAHQDEVRELPKGMKLLARSEDCPIQACELVGRPVFGIQFHPERPPTAGEASLSKKIKANPKAEYLNPGSGLKLFDRNIGETIFRNFFTLERQT